MADTDSPELDYITYAEQPDDTEDLVQVQAPAGKGEETAQVLLRAAEKLDLDPSVVQTADGHFLVPADVADAAKTDLPEGGEVVHLADSSVQGSGDDNAPAEAPEFRTKTEAQDFAKVHDLDVDDQLRADDYKTAVAKAYADKRADTATT